MAYACLCTAGLTPSMPPLPCNEVIGTQQHINFTTSFDVPRSKSKQHSCFFFFSLRFREKRIQEKNTGVSCEMTSHQSPASFESEIHCIAALVSWRSTYISLVSSCCSSAPRSLADETGRGQALVV